MVPFQTILFISLVLLCVRFSVHVAAFLIAGISVKFDITNKWIERILMVMIIIATYPRHGKYFERL